MAYPPALPPTTRTNSTAMATNHPNDHNTIVSAISDVIGELGNNPSGPEGTVQFRLSEMQANKLSRNGTPAMQGDLDMGGHAVTNMADAPPGPNSAVPQQWANEHYVNKSGDTMAGHLVINGLPNDGPGIQLEPDGGIATTLNTETVSLNLRRGPAANAVGQRFIKFESGTAPGTYVGSIEMKTSSTVSLEVPSDHRLKQNNGPVQDPAGRIQTLAATAFQGEWIADAGGGQQWDLLYAHDIDAVAPYAVTGELDAVDGDGNPVYQTVAYASLVPLLVAALGNALDRIAALENPGP